MLFVFLHTVSILAQAFWFTSPKAFPFASLTAAMYMHDWPWETHACETTCTIAGKVTPCPHGNGWSIQCWTCSRHLCQEPCTCDACQLCGHPTCSGCLDAHREHCTRSWTPLLRKYPALQCHDCQAPIDVCAQHCEECYKPQCLNYGCKSQLLLCHGRCHRDICGRRSCSMIPNVWNLAVILPFNAGTHVNENLPALLPGRCRYCLRDLQLVG